MPEGQNFQCYARESMWISARLTWTGSMPPRTGARMSPCNALLQLHRCCPASLAVLPVRDARHCPLLRTCRAFDVLPALARAPPPVPRKLDSRATASSTHVWLAVVPQRQAERGKPL